MDKLIGQIKRRPRFGISAAVIAIFLLIATIVPFKMERTIGYEVAIAGVDKELAMDEKKISTLLTTLGMDKAQFEIGECEPKCLLTISELESEDDVNLVVAAFDEMEDCELDKVVPINVNERITIMERVKIVINQAHLNKMNNAEIHRVVVDKLDALQELNEGEFNIFIYKDSDQAEGNRLIVNFESDDASVGGLEIENPHSKVKIVDANNGHGSALIYDNDGEFHKIDLSDPEAAQKLAEHGINIKTTIDLRSGTATRVYYCSQDSSMLVTEDDCPLHKDDMMSKISDDVIPRDFRLNQNYPNPFNPFTSIIYNIPRTEHVSLRIYNINGQKVRTLVDETLEPGTHSVIWDSTDDNGQKVASGTYLYRLTAGDFTDSKKMSLIK